jgi:hypothetical protein
MRQRASLVGPRLDTALVLACLVGFVAAAFAQADPRIGTWRLLTGKSVYSPGPPPRSQVRVYSQEGGGLKAIIETVQPLGVKTKVEYTAQFDGKDYPVSGSTDADTIALTRIDTWTWEATLKRSGKAVTTIRNTVSKDGKAMTVTSKGVNAKGQPVSSTAYFTKQ